VSERTAFYCVVDDRYFLGAVGMINSLRLQGHREPVFVCDCGLTEGQRRLLGQEATVVSVTARDAPQVLKAAVPRSRPADVAVLIDADMIVIRPLDELIEIARQGKVVAGDSELDRFCPEWGELLDLGEVRPTPYVSTGLVLLGGQFGAELLELVDERRSQVDFEQTFWRNNVEGYPLVHADQDLINAVLAARARDEQIFVFHHRLSASPPFAGLRVLDERELRCAYGDGTEPYVVHHWLAKPWLERTHHGVYSRLLRRLLVGDDVAIRVPADRIPLRFRTGLRAYAERKRINASERIRWHLVDPLRR
jgi:hypothetical protein